MLKNSIFAETDTFINYNKLDFLFNLSLRNLKYQYVLHNMMSLVIKSGD